MKKLLDHDSASGITRIFHYDETVDEEHFYIETLQDVDALVESNKRQFNDAKRGFHGEELSKVATIPMNVLMDLMKKGIWRDPVAMKRWLNDPDNAVFRTKPGVI